MVATETYKTRRDGVKLLRTYSTAGMMIMQTETGTLYDEAIDPEGSGRTYTETDIPIETEGNES